MVCSRLVFPCTKVLKVFRFNTHSILCIFFFYLRLCLASRADTSTSIDSITDTIHSSLYMIHPIHRDRRFLARYMPIPKPTAAIHCAYKISVFLCFSSVLRPLTVVCCALIALEPWFSTVYVRRRRVQ